MPSFFRLAAVLPLVWSTGCYMAANDAVDSASTSGLSSSSGGESGSATGPVTGERGIIEHDGFKLYWEHYDAWEQGACTRLRLKNEGGEVRGWEMTVDLSDDITNWIDSGGAFMWLVDDQITVEQEDYSDFDAWESVEMYYCAEPAAEVNDFTITWREGEDRDGGSTGGGSGDDDPVDLPSLDGELDYVHADGRSVTFHYEGYENEGYTCLNFDVENTHDAPLVVRSITTELSNDTEFVYFTGGTVIDTDSDELAFVFDDPTELEPGESVSGRACMTLMAEPTSVSRVVFAD